jgi:flavocytochrome c
MAASAGTAGGDGLPAEVDLLVVGGGLAGYCAALEAANRGISVGLVEKQPRNGGATVLSGGSFSFAGTPLQRSLGIEDSSERLFEDLRRVGQYENDLALVQAYVDDQLAAHEWLAEAGVAFDRVFVASGQSVPRAHSRNAREVLDIIVSRAHATGLVQTCLSTRAHRLTRSSDGRVIGAVVESADGRRRPLAARNGVVLSTGGFQRNEKLLGIFAPQQAGAQRMGSPGNTGDGLLMAWQLGAAFRDIGYIKGTFGSHLSAGSEDHFLLFPMYAGAIIVNARAERFIDESLSYKLLGEACLKQPDCIGYQIFDQRIFERGRAGIPSMDFQADLDAGRIISAPTLKQLASLLDLDPEALATTVEEYNRSVDDGHDPAFSREALCNGYGELVRIDRPPFHAFASTTVVLATYCGLTVDASTRVQDIYGETILGLFAAGGVMGGFHGSGYMTGTANGKAVIFGRRAAQAALRL